MSDRASEPQPGLENNPGTDGNLFSQEHPYYPDGCLSCPFAGGTLRALYHTLAAKQDCHRCRSVDRVIQNKRTHLRKEVNLQEYDRLSKDSRYTDVEYDEQSGGVTASHIGHCKHPNSSERFFGSMTGDDLENEIKHLLFKSGHSVIFCDESRVIPYTRHTARKTTYTALDMCLDGVMMDIASVTKDKPAYGWKLKAKNHQLEKYNARPDVHVAADTVCLYFHDPRMFSMEKVRKGIDFLKEQTATVHIRHIKCVLKTRKGVKIIDIDT